MIPLHDAMPGALGFVLRRAPLTPEKVAFAWRVTVGPAIDRATTVELRDTVLYVRAKDRAWHHEIDRSSGLIRMRLSLLLGNKVVQRIEVADR